jgi:hypothetical protein
MTDRIRTLVKRISETRPVQSARRNALTQELRQLRDAIDVEAAPDQVHSLDAALLLLEFMGRSESVATSETLQIVASLVGMVDERSVREGGSAPKAITSSATKSQASPDVSEHADLRLSQGFLLGTILLQAGIISPDTLTRALHLHAASGQPIGECLVRLGAATAAQIAGAVAYQDQLREGERHARQAEAARPELRLSQKQQSVLQSMNAQVLGEVLIRLGSISREQLERALHVQRAASVHIGEALVETGAATWDQVKKALEVQRQLRRWAA